MKVAAATFSILPKIGSQGRSRTGVTIGRIFSPLKTTLTLIESDGTAICVISSHLMTHIYRYSNLLRRRVADRLGVPFENVLSFSSHNHCTANIIRDKHAFGAFERDTWIDEQDLTWEGLELLTRAEAVAANLREKLEDVELRWGLGHERRISHNRKGYRADGSTYMMREEDRLRLGADFCGDIDDSAAVIGFFGRDGAPRALLAHFTAHPVTAYDPEAPVVFGEFAQVACDALSDAMGGAPVGFLQGCAGDVNSKGLLSHKPVEQSVADATHYGHCLAQTWIDAITRGNVSSSNALGVDQQVVQLPFDGVPPMAALEADIAEMEDFVRRCGAGDESTTRSCQGLNFPSTMSPRYRGELIAPLLRWSRWAHSFHLEGRLDAAPTHAPVEVASLRIGDVGIVGLCCEPFQAIGTQIRQASPMALTLPCGYMFDTNMGYIPDAGNNGTREYMSSFYRYTTALLPFAQPAGDALAEAGVAMLRGLST